MINMRDQHVAATSALHGASHPLLYAGLKMYTARTRDHLLLEVGNRL